MALKVFFSGERPGYGTVAIGGTELTPAGLEIAIQRNLDDKYLGQNQSWHTTPYWHSPARVESGLEELRLKVGPEIVDGLVAVSHMPLLLWARTGGIERQGVLRFRGQPLGSHAASEDTVELRLAEPEPPVQETDNPPEDDKTHLQEQERLREEAERKEEQRQQDERRLRAAEAQVRKQRRTRRLRLLTLMLFILLLIAGGIVAWQLGWLDRFRPTPNEPSKPETSSQTNAPQQEASPQPPAIQGRKFVQSYLQREPKPTPQEMAASAKEREKEQDCEAAMILYNFAADADADQAMALAQRYDPDTFQAGPCVKSPAPDTASHWYENPAKAGNAAAQRQLGKILTSKHASGPVYDQGIRWLEQAAGAGDEEAKKLLAEKGEG